MTVRILRDAPVESFPDFLGKYHFQEIPLIEFRLLKGTRRPLRTRDGFQLYGFRTDSRLTGTGTTYFFRLGTKFYKSSIGNGSTNILWSGLMSLYESGRLYAET